MKNECSRNDPGFPEDLFKHITFKWRQRTNQEILLPTVELEDPPEFTKATYIKLKNSIPKKKFQLFRMEIASTGPLVGG